MRAYTQHTHTWAHPWMHAFIDTPLRKHIRSSSRHLFPPVWQRLMLCIFTQDGCGSSSVDNKITYSSKRKQAVRRLSLGRIGRKLSVRLGIGTVRWPNCHPRESNSGQVRTLCGPRTSMHICVSVWNHHKGVMPRLIIRKPNGTDLG